MLILLALIVWPVAELLVAIQVAGAIGVLWTVLLLVLGWPLGMWLVRVQGRGAWRRLSGAVAMGSSPGREVVDGALIVIGGMLLIIPGFITDVLGLLLLAPPTRALARRGLLGNLQSRWVVAATRYRRPGAPAYDVDSTAADSTTSPLGRGPTERIAP